MNSKISIKKLIKKPLIMFINDPIKAIIRYVKMSLRKKSKLLLCNEIFLSILPQAPMLLQVI